MTQALALHPGATECLICSAVAEPEGVALAWTVKCANGHRYRLTRACPECADGRAWPMRFDGVYRCERGHEFDFEQSLEPTL